MNAPQTRAFHNISPQDAATLIRSETMVALFDVRDLPSYQQGHIDGAAHLVEQRVVAWMGRLPKDAPIVIYCYKGNASKVFAQMFADFRFTRAYSVDGGYEPLAAALAA